MEYFNGRVAIWIEMDPCPPRPAGPTACARYPFCARRRGGLARAGCAVRQYATARSVARIIAGPVHTTAQ